MGTGWAPSIDGKPVFSVQQNNFIDGSRNIPQVCLDFNTILTGEDISVTKADQPRMRAVCIIGSV
jgi:hypothetical protein